MRFRSSLLLAGSILIGSTLFLGACEPTQQSGKTTVYNDGERNISSDALVLSALDNSLSTSFSHQFYTDLIGEYYPVMDKEVNQEFLSNSKHYGNVDDYTKALMEFYKSDENDLTEKQIVDNTKTILRHQLEYEKALMDLFGVKEKEIKKVYKDANANVQVQYITFKKSDKAIESVMKVLDKDMTTEQLVSYYSSKSGIKVGEKTVTSTSTTTTLGIDDLVAAKKGTISVSENEQTNEVTLYKNVDKWDSPVTQFTPKVKLMLLHNNFNPIDAVGEKLMKKHDILVSKTFMFLSQSVDEKDFENMYSVKGKGYTSDYYLKSHNHTGDVVSIQQLFYENILLKMFPVTDKEVDKSLKDKLKDMDMDIDEYLEFYNSYRWAETILKVTTSPYQEVDLRYAIRIDLAIKKAMKKYNDVTEDKIKARYNTVKEGKELTILHLPKDKADSDKTAEELSKSLKKGTSLSKMYDKFGDSFEVVIDSEKYNYYSYENYGLTTKEILSIDKGDVFQKEVVDKDTGEKEIVLVYVKDTYTTPFKEIKPFITDELLDINDNSLSTVANKIIKEQKIKVKDDYKYLLPTE